jgi:hypothetical protein
MDSCDGGDSVLLKAVERARRRIDLEADAVDTPVSGHTASFPVSARHPASFVAKAPKT